MTTYPTAPVMVWNLTGQPRRDSLTAEPVDAFCAMCGWPTSESVPVKRTIAGKSFTDQYFLARPGSDRTCYPCAWVCTGKGMDQVRMWTVVARTDMVLPPSNPKAVFATSHVHYTSRADMRAVVDTLTSPPAGQWVVSVAESGQKHTLPYAQINTGSGRWRVRMDALDVDATPGDFATVFGHACTLRHAGHSADEIEHLNPHFGRLKTLQDLDTWDRHSHALQPWRSSPLLHLALFLITKEHIDGYLADHGPDRTGQSHRPDRPGDPLPRRDARLSRGGDHRPQPLVGPGPHRPGSGSSDRDRLF